MTRFIHTVRVMFPAFVFALMACGPDDLHKGAVSLSLGDYPMALRFFGKAADADPDSYQARLGLGQALLQKAFAESDSASFAYALVQLEACRSLEPSRDLSGLLAEAYTERARIHLTRKDTLSALSALSLAIDRDPANPQPLNLAGIVYGSLGETAKAEALFRKALQADSADASPLFNLGMIFWQRGDIAGANEYWLKALTLLPQDEDVVYWFALSRKRLEGKP